MITSAYKPTMSVLTEISTLIYTWVNTAEELLSVTYTRGANVYIVRFTDQRQLFNTILRSILEYSYSRDKKNITYAPSTQVMSAGFYSNYLHTPYTSFTFADIVLNGRTYQYKRFRAYSGHIYSIFWGFAVLSPG